MHEGDEMKNTILGLCIGLMLGLSTNAFAATGDIIQATFSVFTFKVDGQVKALDADPLVYQGTTYLPVRTIANLVGKDVVYKADSKTIELNTPIESIQPTSGGNTVQSNVQKDMTIDEINGRIQGLKIAIKGNEMTIYSTDPDPSEKANLLAQIDQWKDEISQLEAKKAQLVP